MQKLYSALRISEAIGVSRQYVSRFVKENCPEAKVGTKIDIEHPVMKELMKRKGADTSAQLKPSENRTSHLAKKPVTQSRGKRAQTSNGTKQAARPKQTAVQNKTVEEIDIADHGELTLNEIVAYFGSDERYCGFLDAKKKQVEIVERELKVQKQLGDMIDREFVSKFIVSVIDGFNSRLLTDFCKSTPIDMRAAFESGKDNIEIEKILRVLISNQLNPLIKKLSEAIRD